MVFVVAGIYSFFFVSVCKKAVYASQSSSWSQKMMFVNTNVKNWKGERVCESERGRQKKKKPFKIICVVHINRICYRNIKKGVSIQRCSCWIELLYKLFTVRCYKKPLEMVVFRRMAYFDSCVSTSNISIRTRMHVSFVNIRSFNIMLCTVKEKNIWEPFLKCEPGWFPFYYTWGPTS